MEEPRDNDHDLLIRVDTKLGNLIDEFRLLRDDVSRRLLAVERGKLDKDEFNTYKTEREKDEVKNNILITNDIAALKRSNSRMVVYLAAIAGGLSVLQFLIPLVLKAWLGGGVS